MTRSWIGMECSKYGGEEWCYRNLVEKPELRRPRGRPGLPAELLARQDVFCPLESATCLILWGQP